MRRIGIIFCAALFLAAIPVSHYALANGNANKVSICHFPDGKEIGDIIEVSGNGSAVSKHVTLHGDATKYLLLKGGGCVGQKGKCDPILEAKCKKLGGKFDPKTCKCITKDPGKCTDVQIAKCKKLGGVLDKNCNCIVKK